MVEISKLALIQILGINTNKIPDAQIALQFSILFYTFVTFNALKAWTISLDFYFFPTYFIYKHDM